VTDVLRDLWHRRSPLPDAVLQRFGELVAAASAPIDDVRGTAAYRRHALGVLARRTLSWAWDDYWATGQAAA
jgi:CO/xanthine dehydrogenase FAD-binding subunit